MHQLAKALYTRATTAHAELYALLYKLERHTRGCVDLVELADVIHALRLVREYVEDARKEVNKLSDTLQRQCCLAWSTTDGEPIRTPYCTATPDLKQTVATPKPDTEEYRQLCAHYGVDPDGPFRPHWPSMLDRVTQDLREGKPIPPGCDPNRVMTVFAVATRKKTGTNIDQEDEPIDLTPTEEEERQVLELAERCHETFGPVTPRSRALVREVLERYECP